MYALDPRAAIATAGLTRKTPEPGPNLSLGDNRAGRLPQYARVTWAHVVRLERCTPAGASPGRLWYFARPMGASKISDEAVRHVARLASLALGPDELGRARRELDAILGYMEDLEQVDVTGVPPTFQAVPMQAPLRPDVVAPSSARAELLAGAPAAEAHAFSVPKVLDGD